MNDPMKAATFRYEAPRQIDRAKVVKMLHRRPELFCAVQVVNRGGETNLHAHPHLDGFWFVLAGRARFYTEENRVVGELGRHEGIVIPRNYLYWFENIGDEPLEILQVEAWDHAGPAEQRTDVTPKTAATVGAMADRLEAESAEGGGSAATTS